MTNDLQNSAGAKNEPPKNWQRGFWSLIATQFQTAFNDNALKFLVIYIVVATNFPAKQRDLLVLVIGALFALPFIFFSMTGGYFADRYSKRSVTIGTKFLEIGVMAFFIVGLALRNIPMECAGVFLISTEAALFGPSKYGLLPELLPDQRLSWETASSNSGRSSQAFWPRWWRAFSRSAITAMSLSPASCSSGSRFSVF